MKLHRYDQRNDLVPMDVDGAIARGRAWLASKHADPAAVAYTVEQCEDLLAHLETLKEQQQRGPNERITRLLESPTDVLSNREQWPDIADLSGGADLLIDAYRRWLLAHAKEYGEPWEEAARWVMVHGTSRENDPHARALAWLLRHASIPFPVGASCPELKDGYPAAAARELMPFVDDAQAALVVPLLAADRNVTLFLMARRVQYEVLLDGEWRPASPVPIIDGKDVRTNPPRPRNFSNTRRHARTWWKSMAGLRIDPGERNRDRDRSPRQMIDALIAYKTDNGPEPPSQEAFMEWWLRDRKNPGSIPDEDRAGAGPNPETWKRVLRDEVSDPPITWSDIVSNIYGDSRRTRRRVNRG